MLTTLAEKVDPRNAAVLVVDMQNDFCHPDGASGRNGRSTAMAEAMTPNLQRLLKEARGAGVPVIFIRMVRNEHTRSEVEREHRLRRGGEAPVCIEGSWGAEWYGVEPEEGEAIVTKHRYSAFIGTDLDLILRSKGIKSLIVTGVATNVCVESTARDGYMLDYYVVFMVDCSACSAGGEVHQATLDNIERTFGVLASVDELVACWQTAAVPV
jgi:ureidoacrylate peracid hydrolase